MIALKDERVPASECANELVRVPVAFGAERLEEKLASFATAERVLVVIEGVLMYLRDVERAGLVDTLRATFPRQTLVCDLMTETFFDRYTGPIHEAIEALGATFIDLSDTPEAVFLERGYREARRISVVGRGSSSAPSASRASCSTASSSHSGTGTRSGCSSTAPCRLQRTCPGGRQGVIQ